MNSVAQHENAAQRSVAMALEKQWGGGKKIPNWIFSGNLRDEATQVLITAIGDR